MIENLTRGLLRTEKALRRWDATNQNSIPHGWLADTATWTYASASTFTVAGDRTAEFTEGLYIKLTQSATVAYFWVVSSAYDGSTNTTVTVQGTDLESPATLASAAISATYTWVSSIDVTAGYVLKAAGSDGPVWEPVPGILLDYDKAYKTSDSNTASTTFGDLADMSVSLTVDRDAFIVIMVSLGKVRNSGAGNASIFAVYKSAVQFTPIVTAQPSTNNYDQAVSIHTAQEVSSGTHTYNIKWRVNGGTGYVYAYTASMIALAFAR